MHAPNVLHKTSRTRPALCCQWLSTCFPAGSLTAACCQTHSARRHTLHTWPSRTRAWARLLLLRLLPVHEQRGSQHPPSHPPDHCSLCSPCSPRSPHCMLPHTWWADCCPASAAAGCSHGRKEMTACRGQTHQNLHRQTPGAQLLQATLLMQHLLLPPLLLTRPAGARGPASAAQCKQQQQEQRR
jgi:hypothetical protein